MDNVERKLVNSAPRRRKFGVCQTHFLFVKRWNSDAFDVEINENQSGDNNLSTGRDVEATVSVPNKEWALDFLKVFYWVNFRKKLVCYVNSAIMGMTHISRLIESGLETHVYLAPPLHHQPAPLAWYYPTHATLKSWLVP